MSTSDEATPPATTALVNPWAAGRHYLAELGRDQFTRNYDTGGDTALTPHRRRRTVVQLRKAMKKRTAHLAAVTTHVRHRGEIEPCIGNP